jgi:small-conductance mechanosensitive channel
MKTLLNVELMGNSVGLWLAAIAAAAALSLVLLVLRRYFTKFLEHVTQKTSTRVDDMLPGFSRRAHGALFLIVGVVLAAAMLELPVAWHGALKKILIVAFILQFARWANYVLSYWLRYLAIGEGGDASRRTSVGVLKIVGRMLIWTLVLLLILENLGFDLSAILTGLGIGGIAVALAVQNVLGDLLASLSIILDKPFVVGDSIVVDNLTGTIEHIGLKSTRLRSITGEQLIISNADLLKSRVRNFKRMSERRVLIALGVNYNTPLEKVRIIPSLLRAAVSNETGVRFDRAHFKEFGAYALNFELVYYVLNSDFMLHMDIQERVNMAIAELFEREKVEFAFPTQTIHLNQ